MAKKPKTPAYTHCKVKETSNVRAPWRVWFAQEKAGKPVRVFKSFADEGKARAFATEKDLEISNHGIRYGDIPPEARRAFDAYRDAAAKFNEAGFDVPRFEELVNDALAQIRTRFHELNENAVSVAEGAEIFLAYKQSRVGTRQLADLRTRLKRFAETFGTHPVRAITTGEIETWLENLRSRRNSDKNSAPPLLGPLSRNHHRATLHSFFKYGAAPARGWSDRNPLTDLEPERVETSEPEAYCPEDAAKLLQTAIEMKPELVPVLALGMFCGLRVSEALEIDLGKLPKKAGEFRTTGKTGPRMAPLTDAAAAWLSAQKRRKGKAWQLSARAHVDSMQELFKLAGVKPIHNGARHSFISYRTAETRDVARVADECGNSLSTIKNHYRQLVTSETAEEFFAIRPQPSQKSKKITNIETGRKTA